MCPTVAMSRLPLVSYKPFFNVCLLPCVTVTYKKKKKKKTSIEGRELHEFCAERGLEQHIKETTRETYLLDLVYLTWDHWLRPRLLPASLTTRVFGAVCDSLFQKRLSSSGAFSYTVKPNGQI